MLHIQEIDEGLQVSQDGKIIVYKEDEQKQLFGFFADKCKDAIFEHEEPFDEIDYVNGVNDGLALAVETIDEVLEGVIDE